VGRFVPNIRRLREIGGARERRVFRIDKAPLDKATTRTGAARKGKLGPAAEARSTPKPELIGGLFRAVPAVLGLLELTVPDCRAPRGGASSSRLKAEWPAIVGPELGPPLPPPPPDG